ncbi:Uncharacterised protein [Bacillus freudenreichii]|nr:Uncharacterised protein [Bacillus freudenreichii]
MFRRYLIPLISLIGTALVVIGKKLQPKMSYPKGFPIESIEQTINEVTFYLKNEKSPLRIYRDGTLIYEGDDESFTDINLAAGTTYLYTIEAGARRGTPERIKVQTSTAEESRQSENLLEDCIQTAIISKSFFGMEWEPIEGVEEYLIYRNGKRIAKVQEPFFVDRWVRSQMEYTYLIHAERPLPELEEGLDEQIRLRTDPKEKDAVMEIFEISKVLDPLEDILNSRDAKTERKEWRFLYKTFWGERWIKNPKEGSPYRYFKGDGRGFDSASTDYRSMAEIVVTGDEPFPDVQLAKDIGETKGYGMLRNLKKEETASDEGIQLEDVKVEETEVTYVLKHSVENPLADSLAVDYQVSARLQPNGFYDFSGVHDRSLNHEVYLKHGVQRTWTTLHQAEDEGMEAPLYWRVSNFR